MMNSYLSVFPLLFTACCHGDVALQFMLNVTGHDTKCYNIAVDTCDFVVAVYNTRLFQYNYMRHRVRYAGNIWRGKYW